FAFAIWDAAKQHLFMARDRFGEKPLYYSANLDRISFASELTALIKDPHVATTACLLWRLLMLETWFATI
ncbi:unnamed protein product, partial [marine sediment metagenome]